MSLESLCNDADEIHRAASRAPHGLNVGYRCKQCDRPLFVCAVEGTESTALVCFNDQCANTDVIVVGISPLVAVLVQGQADALLREFQIACEDALGRPEDSILPSAKHRAELRADLRTRLVAGNPESWRCFHCGEVFTRKLDAAEHFGPTQFSDPACQVKGHERDLLRVLRDKEIELRRLRNEDEDLGLIRAMQSLKSEHSAALMHAEEQGFARGVKEMQRLAFEQFGREVAV